MQDGQTVRVKDTCGVTAARGREATLARFVPLTGYWIAWLDNGRVVDLLPEEFEIVESTTTDASAYTGTLL